MSLAFIDSFVETFERRFPLAAGTDRHRLVAMTNPGRGGNLTPPSGEVSDAAPVEIRVNGSRWVARCPSPVCGGAEIVNFETGLFFCCSCRNSDWGNDYLPVALPNPGLRRAVERILLVRPNVANRNWEPWETLGDLAAENTVHGLPVPEEI